MKPNTAYLLTLLSNNDVTFFIPPYQRNYEWTDDQCEVFLDDIFKTYEKNKAGEKTEHFIGTVTYFQTESVFGQPSKLVLIDGQQRITTAMLFLVALRDTIADQKLKRFIDSKYLRNENVDGDSEYKIKLKQVESDWASYRNIILGLDLSEKEKNSAVFRNYSYFKNRLSALQDNGHQLQELIEKGLDRFSLITVQLEPDKNEWENPQEIFESMNSLGKPLSLADLVRNYLLLGLDADLQSEYYNRYWLHIEEKIPGVRMKLVTDYTDLGKIQYILAQNEVTVEHTDYTDKVEIQALFSQDQKAFLIKTLTEGTGGRLKMEEGDEVYFAVVEGEILVF